MPLIKTSELIGAALDWAVAKVLGLDVYVPPFAEKPWLQIRNNLNRTVMCPSWSTDWSQGGPIIEQEGILLRAIRREGHTMNGQWLAMYDGANTGTLVTWVKREDRHQHFLRGPTLLIAAMRCFVAMKLGNEVEIPEELCP